MAVLRVRVEAFEEGRLPAICAFTGTPTDSRMEVKALSKPPSALLLVFGVVPYLIAKRSQRTAVGYIPVSSDGYKPRYLRLSVEESGRWVVLEGIHPDLAAAAAASASDDVFVSDHLTPQHFQPGFVACSSCGTAVREIELRRHRCHPDGHSRTRDRGAIGLLAKPIGIDDLTAAIRKVRAKFSNNK